jgi:hypothetical protein
LFFLSPVRAIPSLAPLLFVFLLCVAIALPLCALGFLILSQKAKGAEKNKSGEGIARTPKEKTVAVSTALCPDSRSPPLL